MGDGQEEWRDGQQGKKMEFGMRISLNRFFLVPLLKAETDIGDQSKVPKQQQSNDNGQVDSHHRCTCGRRT